MSELILYAKKNGQLNGQTDRWTAGRTDYRTIGHMWRIVLHNFRHFAPMAEKLQIKIYEFNQNE